MDLQSLGVFSCRYIRFPRYRPRRHLRDCKDWDFSRP